MSEEEIIKKLTQPQNIPLIEIIRKFKREGIENFIITRPELIQSLLDLYNKEKEKNKIKDHMLLVNREEYEIIKNKEKYISKDKIREKRDKDIEINEHTILGGRRNGKTLEYGIRLGRIQMCEELLQEN